MIGAALTLLLGLVVIAVIIVINGYFVAQEFAYMSVDRTQLRARADAGDKKATQALAITNRTSFMLSGAQLGITVTGLLVGFIAEPLVGESLGVLLGGVGVPTAVSVGVGTVLALALSTVIQMIFGELFPKNYTIAAPMKSSLALAPSTSIYLKGSGWLIKFFDVSSNALLKLMRIEPVEDIDSSATAEDLEHIVSTSRLSGDLDDSTFLVLDRLLDFPDHTVGHAMIPRSRTDVLSPDNTLGEARALMAVAHSRYPVIDEDHVPTGVLHLVDVLATDLPDTTPATTLARPAVVVPELMTLPDVVDELIGQEEKMACVIDEYGGFIGIITLEDLAEEILGDVSDEHDLPESEDITETREDQWLVDGDTPLDEVERAIGHDLPEGEFETISGLLLSHAGGLVDAGEIHDIPLAAEPEDFIDHSEPPVRILRIRIESIERNVPATVQLTLIEDHPADGHATNRTTEEGR
ncbi:hemolysin family protein [Corynebacterium gallinarum]|uniref:HlyC/CorC family transporter n=1 Tax=Corynebacterium gallinarum TaxID=2762214 RepID=A0A8I0HC16_9CORY|nr:hemolysin family protein [Corynebacterium gallinarum]MBD8028826.1 HlyC/CorC family transporter [Corynebacterium gallinarum]